MAPFRVLIAGGSISGLTLAHALSHAGIDFVVLEAYRDIAPQVGASVALFPNGARVMDQLGVFDDVLARVAPLRYGNIRAGATGRLLRHSNFVQLLEKRMGYSIAFFERQALLQILYDRLPDQSKVLMNHRVTALEHTTEGVSVTCSNGAVFEGDIVVGADGVHSKIREEMWRLAEEETPGAISLADKTSMRAPYSCVFGISTGVAGIPEGEDQHVYNRDFCFVIVGGRDGRVYWFFSVKLDRVYAGDDIPQFSMADTERFVRRYLDAHVTETTRFRDLWERRVSASHVPLEKYHLETWTWGRVACLGDAVHKVSPNIGQGANAAIESAATISNLLHALLSTPTAHPPSHSEIVSALQQYQSIRALRTKAMCDAGNDLLRMATLQGFPQYILSHYVIPNSGDFLADMVTEMTIGAVRIDYLPLPKRSLGTTMAWSPRLGVGTTESPVRRLAKAAPLILLAFMSWWLRSNSDQVSPSGLVKSIQVIDIQSVYAIWMIESIRRGNDMTTMKLPLIFAILSALSSFTLGAPLYYTLAYMQAPVQKYAAADCRLVNMSRVRTLGLTAVCIAVLPLWFFRDMSVTQHDVYRLSLSSPWGFWPAWLAILHFVLSRWCVRDTTDVDKLENPWADLAPLRRLYTTLGIISAAGHICALVLKPQLVLELVLQGSTSWGHQYMILNAIVFYWVLLNANDLKKAGFLKHSWGKILAVASGVWFVGGPGFLLVALWWMREELLAGAEKHEWQ